MAWILPSLTCSWERMSNANRAGEEVHQALASEHGDVRVERPAWDHITTGRGKNALAAAGCASHRLTGCPFGTNGAGVSFRIDQHAASKRPRQAHRHGSEERCERAPRARR